MSSNSLKNIFDNNVSGKDMVEKTLYDGTIVNCSEFNRGIVGRRTPPMAISNLFNYFIYRNSFLVDKHDTRFNIPYLFDTESNVPVLDEYYIESNSVYKKCSIILDKDCDRVIDDNGYKMEYTDIREKNLIKSHTYVPVEKGYYVCWLQHNTVKSVGFENLKSMYDNLDDNGELTRDECILDFYKDSSFEILVCKITDIDVENRELELKVELVESKFTKITDVDFDYDRIKKLLIMKFLKKFSNVCISMKKTDIHVFDENRNLNDIWNNNLDECEWFNKLIDNSFKLNNINNFVYNRFVPYGKEIVNSTDKYKYLIVIDKKDNIVYKTIISDENNEVDIIDFKLRNKEYNGYKYKVKDDDIYTYKNGIFLYRDKLSELISVIDNIDQIKLKFKNSTRYCGYLVNEY